MNDEKDIERWFKQEMTPEERSAFAQKMSSSPELQKHVDEYQQFVQDLHEIGLRQKVKFAAKANRRLLFLRRLVAILSVLLLLGFLAIAISKWFVVKNAAPGNTPPILDKGQENQGKEEQTTPIAPQSPAPQKQPTMPIAQGPLPRDQPLFRSLEGADGSVDSTMLTVFQAAFEPYTIAVEHKGRFSRAIRLLEQKKWAETRAILTPWAQNDTAKYLLAVLALRAHQPEQAMPYLTALYRDDCPFKAESEWLMGLTMVLQGKEEQAKQLLKHIEGTKGHGHQDAAKSLLGNIQK